MIIGLVAMTLPVGAVFAGRNSGSDCSISPSVASVGQRYTVSAWGLPTRTAINIWVTDPDGVTVGRPLGGTPDGRFDLRESSSSAGTWRYAFSGPTRKHMAVYATCSLSVE
jgi:hypothetical protein